MHSSSTFLKLSSIHIVVFYSLTVSVPAVPMDVLVPSPSSSSSHSSSESVPSIPVLVSSVPSSASTDFVPPAPTSVSTHHMLTRSKLGISKPKIPLSLTVAHVPIEPKSFSDAVKTKGLETGYG